MSREENEAQDLNAVAAALSSLVPSTGRLDRDRLMFLAGEAAGLSHLRARRWPWPAAFSTMSAVAATLLAMLLIRPEAQVIEHIVRVPAEPEVVADTAANTAVVRADAPERVDQGQPERAANDRHPTDNDYLRLRDRVLSLGLDSWTSGRSTSGAAPADTPSNHRQLLESVLKSL